MSDTNDNYESGNDTHQMIKRGDIVRDKKFGLRGVVEDVFKNWDDLKAKQIFATIDPDNESNEMDATEKLINGDPKDAWLKAQKIPFTDEQLNESWYSVRAFNGGGFWTCESLIELTDMN